MAEYPVGKAQQIILNALSLQAKTYAEAEQLFAARGLAISSVREGRTNRPVVEVLSREGSSFNRDGEGEVWDMHYLPVDLDAIRQYLK